MKALPADWVMVVDQTRFDRIAVLTVTPRGKAAWFAIRRNCIGTGHRAV
ncbi:hypothetical protein P0F65_14050 [Sphingomonas sp. I4]